LNTGLIDQGVHFERQISITLLTVAVNFALNATQNLLTQCDRSHQQFAIGAVA
jgi:hypothetical protein